LERAISILDDRYEIIKVRESFLATSSWFVLDDCSNRALPVPCERPAPEKKPAIATGSSQGGKPSSRAMAIAPWGDSWLVLRVKARVQQDTKIYTHNDL
jgi:hypothetical protein